MYRSFACILEFVLNFRALFIKNIIYPQLISSLFCNVVNLVYLNEFLLRSTSGFLFQERKLKIDNFN
jgi:hypothetical protein